MRAPLFHFKILALLVGIVIVTSSSEPKLISVDFLKGKYLDCHAHTAGIGSGKSGCFLAPKLRSSYKFKIYLKAFGVTESELLEKGDGIVLDKISARLSESKNVGAAVILALDGVMDSNGQLDSTKTQVYIPNDFIFNETNKHENLIFGASINPKRKDALSELQKVIANGAILIKWIPSIMDFDPADSTNIPFYLAMKKAGIPLLTHTGTENSFLDAKDSLCDPMRLELPLKLGLTVIAAHVGTPGKSQGQNNYERAIFLMGQYPNLYADISSLTQINKRWLLKKILAHKNIQAQLLYGTDFPLIETLLVSPYYYTFGANFHQLRSAAKISNPWDKDITLKKILGVPEAVFTLSEKLLLRTKYQVP